MFYYLFQYYFDKLSFLFLGPPYGEALGPVYGEALAAENGEA